MKHSAYYYIVRCKLQQRRNSLHVYTHMCMCIIRCSCSSYYIVKPSSHSYTVTPTVHHNVPYTNIPLLLASRPGVRIHGWRMRYYIVPSILPLSHCLLQYTLRPCCPSADVSCQSRQTLPTTTLRIALSTVSWALVLECSTPRLGRSLTLPVMRASMGAKVPNSLLPLPPWALLKYRYYIV